MYIPRRASRRQVLINTLPIVRLGEQSEHKLQNAGELQCVLPYLPPGCLPARVRCNRLCVGLSRRPECHFMSSACLQAALCLFSLLELGVDGFPRASMRQVVWSTFWRTRWQGTMAVLATQQDTNHRYKLHYVPLGKVSGTSCFVHLLLRK